MLGFLLKKTVTAFILPPGLFIALALLAVLLITKRFRSFLLGLLVLMYLVSIEPTKDLLLRPLEDAYPVPSQGEMQRADVIVVLGGGIVDNAPDADGPGAVSTESLGRLYGASKAYAAIRKPVILSGGQVFGRKPESELARRVLLKWGVAPHYIITETRSRDTAENALYVAEICQQRNWRRVVLVTSAYHMKRSVLLFRRHFKEIVPYPTDYKTGRRGYDYGSFLPGADHMGDVAAATKEYVGIIFYKLTSR